MKKLLKILLVLLLLPVMTLTACKKKSLPSINLERYLKDEITVKQVDTDATTKALSLITQDEAKDENLSKYLKFEISTDPVWMYKMYIESITFYVYCNESSEFSLNLNIKITNLATEEAIMEAITENVETETLEKQVSFNPKEKKAIKCTVDVNQTIVNATGSTISIDAYSSSELFSGDEETSSNFMWLIYGLEIHGESRTYTRSAK